MNHSNKSSDFCKIKINKSSKMPKNSKNDFQIEKSQYAHKAQNITALMTSKRVVCLTARDPLACH